MSNSSLRRSVASLTAAFTGLRSTGRLKAAALRKRRRRACRFEALEARRVLASIIWHNVLNPLDVDPDGIVSPLDALQVVNELNRRTYTSASGGHFVEELDDGVRPPFYDVNCDDIGSPLDALIVINALNRGTPTRGWQFDTASVGDGISGGFTASGCHPMLVEGESLRTELTTQVTLFDDASGILLEFETPEFDTDSAGRMQDAFEVTVTDLEGNPVVQPFVAGRTASINWSETTDPAVGGSTTLTTDPVASPEIHQLLVNLAHLPRGTEVLVTARLINNDADNTSSVVLRKVRGVGQLADPPLEPAREAANGARQLEPVAFDQLEDVSSSLRAEYGRTSYTADRSQVITELVVTNLGNQAVTGQLVVVLDRFSDLETFAMRPDGILPDGRPFFDLTDFVDDVLSPGESTRPREVRFTNPREQRFNYRLTTLGDLNTAPGAFTTTPDTRVEAGRSYRTTAAATDVDGHALTYSLVSGPESMTIDAASGELTWETASEDVSRHRVILRATDPFGLFVEQSFTVDVVATLQNRPPNFVSTPLTEAVASAGFEITTVATGDSPTGVTTISGFMGPRLVSLNAGEQTVSVHTGKNDDRFDQTSVYSTGEPQPTGAPIAGGYAVDFGWPPFRVTNDDHDVLGLDQGDLNGDGILDLVSMAFVRTFAPVSVSRYEVLRVLGDGDGNFGEPLLVASLPLSNTPEYKHLQLTDINNDGELDIVILRERSNEGVLFTLSGVGDGTFEPFVEMPLSTSMNDYRAVDLDRDGNVDLVGRSSNAAQFGWLSGNGDGTFDDFTLIQDTGPNPHGAEREQPYAIVDIDNDGDLDAVVGDGRDGVTDVLVNDGQENFTLSATITRPTITRPEGGFWAPLVVHAADFSGDGNADVFIGARDKEGHLFLGDGTGLNFTAKEETSRISRWPGNPAGTDGPIDIDNDGDLDLVIGGGYKTTFHRMAISVLRNNGDGTFVSTAYAPTPLGEISGVMVGDYNRDGVSDLAHYTHGAFHNGVGILPGTRPGEFAGVVGVPTPGGFGIRSVVAEDFNLDGNLDFYLPRNSSMNLGNGDGTFAEPILGSGISRPHGLGVTADFNVDGIPDVLTLHGRDLSYIALLGNGDGTFDEGFSQGVGTFSGPAHLQVADFNGDGLPDFLARTKCSPAQLDVFLNDPEDPGNSFTLGQHIPLSGVGWNCIGFSLTTAIADYDSDGILDLAITDQEADDPSAKMIVMKGAGDGTFTVANEQFDYPDIIGFLSVPRVYKTGDLNEDGNTDLVLFNWYDFRVSLGNGDATFAEPVIYPSKRGSQDHIDFGYVEDLDADGHLDVIYTNPHGGGNTDIHFRRGRGDGTFDEPVVFNGIHEANDLTFADFDNDGHTDIILADGGFDPDTGSLFFGAREGLVDGASADLNGDGNEEVLAVNQQNDRVKLFVGDNLGGLTRQADLLTGRAPTAVHVSDLNGDGEPEIVTTNRTGRSVSVFSGSLDAGYTSAEISVGSAPIDLTSADLDKDGNVDLLVLDEADNAIWVFAGSATGLATVPIATALGDRPGRFTVRDATGDGNPDAVVTLTDSNRIMILPGDGSGGFTAPFYLTLTTAPADVAVVDLNADGNPDLAATVPDEDIVSIFYGRGQHQFAKPQNVVVGDGPRSLEAYDADGDGRIDLIVGNAGDDTASVIYNRYDPNEVYRYDSRAIDPDDDPLEYRVADGPGGLFIDSETGEVIWAASPDQVGQHQVTLEADDGRGGIATQSFVIDVQPPRENASPLIATEPVGTIGANETFEYQVAAVDGDGDPLRYRIVDGPEGSTIDPTTGELQWDGRTDQAFAFAPLGPRTAGQVDIPADASLQPSSITVEGWYNFHLLPAGNSRSYLMRQTGAFGPAYDLYNSFNRLLELEMHFENSQDDLRVSLPFVPQQDRWYHIALTIDDAARQATIYVDGVALGSTPIPQAIAYDPDADSQVGVSATFNTQAIIDNYRIWNVARGEAEICEGMAQQYEGDPRLVLDYRFEGLDAITVRDHSPAGNHGLRVATGEMPQPAPGLANPGVFSFTILVEDGRGGTDLQTFDVEIVPELRGSISGHLFEDLDGDGVRDDGSENEAEPSLEGWQLYIDTNGNFYPDPNERTAITDAGGDYRFDGLLPGEYPVRVVPIAGYAAPAGDDLGVIANLDTVLDLAIEQLALSQIRGSLETENGEPLARWKAFADLNKNGLWDDNEPVGISDRSGNYAITGLPGGDYRILPELPAGWADTAGSDGLDVALEADAIVSGNDFVLHPTNTSVTGGVHFVTTPTTLTVARDVYRYAAAAHGITQEAIAYDLSLAPEGMTVDPRSGLVAWRPTIGQVGEHMVILRATDESGSISLHDFTLQVTAPNFAPVITELPPESGYVGLAFEYDIVAQDAENEPLVYSLLSGPTGASVDADSGRLSWTPAAEQTAEFNVEARDGSGGATTAAFTVTVLSAAPAVLPLAITQPRTTATIAADYVSRVVARDGIGRPVTWSLAAGPDGLTIEGDGTIRWTPAAAQLGTHTVELIASTVDGDTEPVTVDVDVVGSLRNSAPVIESTPLGSAVIGDEYAYDLVATDADNDLLAFALLEAPAGMSIDASRGTIRWTPADDQLGESTVSVRVADVTGAEATQPFTLHASRSGGPPVITSVPTTEASIGLGYFYSVTARDAEGDPLSFRLLAAPAGMTIVESTGEVAWTPEAGQIGQQPVVIEVSDGVGGAATQAFAVLVSDGAPNLPPEITSTAPRFGTVGGNYQYRIAATDPEGTELTYRVSRGPDGFTVDASTGHAVWTPAADQVGKQVVTLRVTDAGGASSIESFELDVLAENRPPVIAGTAPAEVPAGAMLVYDLLANDADLDALTFELVAGPSEATVDPFGRVVWETSVDDIGGHDFEVRASDPRGGSVTQAFTLEVIEDTVPPRLSLIHSPNDGSRNILPWQGPFTVYVRAIDNVEVAAINLQANGVEIPLSAAGTATFTFEEYAFTRINATATAVDIYGNTTTKTTSFDFDFPEGWGGGGEAVPTAAISSPADDASVTGMVSIVGTATHEDFAQYKLSYRRADQDSFTEFFRGETAIENGQLGVWDTSLLENDQYYIRLEVATTAGAVNIVEHSIGLGGELKLGNFRLSFTDMVIPVAGIPIEITRIYDTLQADREGDFGYGWRLEYRNTDLRVGLPESGLEDIGIHSPLRSGVKVYLNVPGQGRQGFTFNPDIRVLPGFGGNNLVLARPRFTPDPGVTSTLSTGTSSYLQVNEQGELYAPGGIPYNPASPSFGGAYVLTTRDGITYRIDGLSGELTSATDRNGNTLTFSDSGIESSVGRSVSINRDANGRIRSIVDPNGNSNQYAYSSSGDLVSVVDRTGAQVTMTYLSEHAHYLDEIRDPLGRPQSRSIYGPDGRLRQVVDVNGEAIELVYEPSNSLVRRTDALGNESLLVYDNAGNVVTKINELGDATRYEYDALGNITALTTPTGRATRYQYNNRGDQTAVIDPAGQVQRTEYNELGLPISQIDALGSVTTFQYDQRGNRTHISLPSGAETSFRYDSSGQPIEGFDDRGNKIRFAYVRGSLVQQTLSSGLTVDYTNDASGIPTSESFVLDTRFGPQAHQWEYESDETGEFTRIASESMTSQVDRNELGLTEAIVTSSGTTQTMAYDNKGQIETLSQANRPAVQFSHDPLGRPTSIGTSTGEEIVISYDAVGRRDRIDVGDGAVTLERDADGRVVSRTDEHGRTISTTYDSVGRVITEMFGGSVRFDYRYDAAGNETAVVLDGQPLVTRTYDQAGRVVHVEHADGTSESFEYDTANNVIRWQSRTAAAWNYEYDGGNNLTRVVDPGGLITEYGYDALGNLDFIRDAAGQVTEVGYDGLGRRTSWRLPDGSVETTRFDAKGRVESVDTIGGETLSFVYDEQNRIREVRRDDVVVQSSTFGDQSRTVEGLSGVSQLSSDEDGRLISWTDPLGGRVQAVRQQGRLASIETDAAIRTVNRELGRISTLVDQIGEQTATVAFSYDRNGMLESISLPGNIRWSSPLSDEGYAERITLTSASDEVLAEQVIERSGGGRIMSITQAEGVETSYRYDASGRLIEEARSEPTGETNTIRYEYDDLGNRVAVVRNEVRESYQFDSRSRLVESDSEAFTYNDRGDLTAIFGDDRDVTLGYDAEHRLTEVTTSIDTASVTVGYQYDFDGLLLSRTESGETIHFIWDRFSSDVPMLLEIRDDAGSLLRRFGHDGMHYLYSIDADGEITYLMNNHIGSVVGEFDQSGAMLRDLRTDAFGGLDQPLDQLSVGFAGGIVDPTTGYVYLRARWYDPAVGRFLQADLAEADYADPRSLHRYAYALGDPVGNVDRDGYFTLTEQQQSLFVQSTLATIIVGAAGYLATNKGFLKAVSGGRLTFENNNGSVRPLAEVDLSGSVGAGRGISFSGGIVGGIELVSFGGSSGSSLPSVFGYIGVGGAVNAGVSTEKSDGGFSFGLSVRTAVGDLFEATEPEHYAGHFISITGGTRLYGQFSAGGARISGGVGAIVQVAFSPTPIEGTSTYTHTHTVFTAGAGVGSGDSSFAQLQSTIGFGYSYYVDLTEHGEFLTEISNRLARSRLGDF